MQRKSRIALAAAAALMSPAAASPGAGAEVMLSPKRVVVTTPGASAVVKRSPLRISFRDGRGRTVLRQVAGAGGARLVLPVPRVQFGTQTPPPATLYAPLGFLVGSHTVTQETAQQWEGNLLAVTEGGTEYGATEVVVASRRGRGARLVAATSDPSGRRLVVDVRPGPEPATIAVSARPTPAAGVAAMSDSFTAVPGEAFRGFGGRHNAIDQRGDEFYNWLQQENLSSGSLGALTAVTPGMGEAYLFPNGEHAAYYAQSSFVSPGRYGFLLDQDEISHWRMASDHGDAWQTQVAAPRIDYVVAPGGARRAIRTVTAITGRQRVPPRWAVGPILDREVIFNDDPPDKYEGEVRDDLRQMRRARIPFEAYRIEGWQFLPRDVLRELIAKLRRRGIHPMLYFRAFVGQDNIGTDDPAMYDEALDGGFVATTEGGAPYTFISNFNALGAQIDFTDPEARHWWRGRITEALRLGADGFMQDFGEQVLVDMHFDDGSTGYQMHNRLATLYHRTTYRAVRAFERRHPRRHIFYFTRAGHSGSPGAARWEFGNFPGDETTDWTRSAGLASQTPDMLNRAIGGAYGFTTDIGGYFDVGPYQPTTRELFLRWAEWAALSPMFRLHGSVGAGVHTPWSYDRKVVRIYRRLARLHVRARPLILRLWRRAKRTGIPITRPLWLAYPGDSRAAQEDQQWLLGRNVLVAPVVEQGATQRVVYFPRGCWQRPGGGPAIRGPREVAVAAPLQRLPYFFRCGKRPFRAPAARR